MSHFTNPHTVVAKPSSTFQTDNITNSTAESDTDNRYNICQRTGFKVKPGTLIEEWNGTLVRAFSWEPRNLQDLVRTEAESLVGPSRPEGTDTFITTSIAPEDL
jgi:hypothetical protein